VFFPPLAKQLPRAKVPGFFHFSQFSSSPLTLFSLHLKDAEIQFSLSPLTPAVGVAIFSPSFSLSSGFFALFLITLTQVSPTNKSSGSAAHLSKGLVRSLCQLLGPLLITSLPPQIFFWRSGRVFQTSVSGRYNVPFPSSSPRELCRNRFVYFHPTLLFFVAPR